MYEDVEGENYNALNSKQYPQRTYDSPNRPRKQIKSNNHAIFTKFIFLTSTFGNTIYKFLRNSSTKENQSHAVFKSSCDIVGKGTLRRLVDSHIFQSTSRKSSTKTNKGKSHATCKSYTIFLVDILLNTTHTQSTKRKAKSRRIARYSQQIDFHKFRPKIVHENEIRNSHYTLTNLSPHLVHVTRVVESAAWAR